ncbi:putative porin [Hymenobacter negativus]|uniref:Porin n=1 Tax=Hymenobacter negativus TaxID=2795026 RepID=A0ABS3Q8C8_9BACT|nr:putative porin [Hymenobacter negativus]MBO2007504.1 hypothetical protein [Hymenobacter negativus]
MIWTRLRPLAVLLVVLALWGAPGTRAQVRDDSTKVLYGPKTTRIIYEAEVLRDSTSGTPLDTTLTRWPQARFWFHDTTFQQDLGAVGTASRPLLYQPNYQLGARFGRNVFDKYARDATTVPYYDSRSPYSFFRYIQSGAGEQVFEISYSRSLKKNFSVGLAYERIASNKVLDPVRSRDGLVEHSNILLFGRYQTDDERYHLLINFSNVRHRAVEQGGIRPVTTTSIVDGETFIEGENRPQELFKYAQQKVNLSQAVNTEDRDELYFTQTYRLLGRGLTAYHTFDAKRQYNSYYDKALTLRNTFYQPDVLYYPRVLRNTAAILDRAEYRQVENTVGLLGRTDAVEYRIYSRFRNASLVEQSLKSNQQLYQAPISTGLELEEVHNENYFNAFVGGTAAFNYRKIYAIEAAGEYKVGNEYWAQASIRTGPLSAEALVNSYSPTLMQQEHVGNNYEWHNDSLNNTSTQQLTGRLRLKLPNIGILTDQRFEASASVANIINLVYYGTDGRPTQLSATRNLLIVYARHTARLGRVGFDNQATYTRGGEADKEGIRIPSLVSNSRVYYESYIFRKALFTQVGAEMYFQSRFQAYNYSPSTQQFYQQETFSIRPYPLVDVFLSADIKTVSVFLKVAYLNQGVLDNGYFTTPYYTGYPRRFQFGVKWNFFN